jgi:hypothetical protein
MTTVIQPAKIGRETISKIEVVTILIIKTEITRLIPFNEVIIKLIDPKTEDNPTMCKENNIISIDEQLNIERGT